MRQFEYIEILYAFHIAILRDEQRNTNTVLITLFGIPETSKEIYFLRFFSRVRSSFIDIVGSFLLSSINFQKVEDV